MEAVVISDVIGTRAGAYTATLLLCRALDRMGLEVTCFSSWVEPEVTGEGFIVIRPLITRGYRWDWPNRCLALQAISHVKRRKPGLVIVVGVTRLSRYFLQSAIAHLLVVWELTNGCGNKFVDAKAGGLLSRCKAMLSPSSTIDSNIRKHYKFEGAILRLPFWVEDQELEFASTPVEFLADFIYFGRRDEEKGLGELIEATAIVAREAPGVRTVIGGVGDAQPFVSLAKALNVEKNIVIGSFPAGTDVCKALATSRCLVLPSYHEGYPLVLLEAAQFGLPFIATEVGSIPEVFGGSRACSMVKPRDPKSLAQAMKSILNESADEHAERRKAAYEMFRKLSSATRVQENLSKVLSDLKTNPLS